MNQELLSHRRPSKLKKFYFGAPYYPEHWDRATRENDAEWMSEAHFNLVRIAEFAWDRIEPAEGTYDFSLFDETISRLGEKGIQTMLCTPTATPPAWLFRRHPDIARVDANLSPMCHGSRQHACHTNETFRHYSRIITQAMADHYRDNPYVVAWQTDNEFNCHFSECHCQSCNQAFAAFLAEKYGNDISKLNDAWGSAFWSQTYTSFDQIATPRDDKPTYVNPSQQLDYFRFISASVTSFQREQVVILREANPLWVVTHNGLFRHIDYRGDFTRDLDVLGFDSYPFFDTDPDSRPSSHAFNLDRVRAWSGNFIIPEQQSGPGGQKNYFLDNPEPGEIRRMTYTALSRGADSLLYFRWRTCRFGAESYWCGIIDHDNIRRRRYDEVAKTGRELLRVGERLLGTHVRLDAAVATSDQDVNDAESTLPLGLPSPDKSAEIVHRFLFTKGYAVGCVHPSDDLSGIRLYVIPHWAVFNDRWVDNLNAFVDNGGVLVIGARTATRGWNNQVIGSTPPGCLGELAGVAIVEYGRQNVPAKRKLKVAHGGIECATQHWYEVPEPLDGTDVLATWNGRHLTGVPAITRRKRGLGSVVYVGSYLTPELVEMIMPSLIADAGLQQLWPTTPEGIAVSVRENRDRTLWFFVNHSDEHKVIQTLPKGIDLVTGVAPACPLALAPNDVVVIESSQTT